MHLYVHVPFCARRCSYCDFAIAVRRNTPSRDFLNVILREWEGWQQHSAWQDSPELETIYLGGGTPSRLESGVLSELLQRLTGDRPLAREAEVTIEINPDDVNSQDTEAWLRAGINRFSVGAQSFNPAALEWMHRTHSAEQIAKAIGILRDGGAWNLSLDLIYGLPEAIPRDWLHDLEEALALSPEHLSLYGLTVESHTPLARWVARGQTACPSDQRAAEEYLAAHARIREAGYEHYEVSNAARPGFRSRHNQAYWNRRSFIGLGPSAHSGIGATRSWNVREWEQYRTCVLAGTSPIGGTETLDPEQIELEELYLGLRTLEGLPGSRIGLEAVERWQEAGWAVSESSHVRLSALGWLRLDALVGSLTHC